MRTSRRSHKALIIILCAVVFFVAAAATVYLLWANDHQMADTTKTDQPSTPTKTALTCSQDLPSSILVGQKLMVAVYNSQTQTVQSVVSAHYLNGVIVMEEMSADAIKEITEGQRITPTIATDQEGGTVQRFKSEGALLGASDVASTQTTSQAYNAYLSDAIFLKSMGITTNFAPVVDVESVEPSPLPGRMYSTDPTVVTSYATQMVQASQQAKITPVLKHFPGLGSASGNTDQESATTDAFDTLKSRDLLPYQSMATLKTDAMISNAITPNLTNGQPAVWSADAVSLLRSYGYQDAVIYSDSLTAKAIPGSLSDAAIKAWQAGVDVALIVQESKDTAQLENTVSGIIDAAETALENGALNKDSIAQSVVRILNRKGVDPCSIQVPAAG